MHDLRKIVLTGTFWTTGSQIVAAGLRFGIMLILARLLSPEFFGLLGMSMVIMLILRNISDMGFGAALVQRKQIDETDLATVFWFNLTMSLLLGAFLFAGSGTLAQLLGDVRLEMILRTLAILLPVNALTMVPQAVLRRNLEFAKLSLRDIAGMVGFGMVGVPLAMLGMGYWSLIGALAAQWIFCSALVWLVAPYRPLPMFKWSRLQILLGFGFWMFVSMLASRLMNNVDYFMIGRFLGATDLGYYTLAFQLVIIPIQRITAVLGNVLFPSFSKIQNQPARLQKGFLEALRILVLVLFPISAFFIVEAGILVPLLYSSKWLPAVPVVQLLAFASFFYGIDIMNAILNAIGKPHWRFVVLGFRATIFVFLAWGWGLTQGIEGIALCILIAVALSIILQLLVLMHELKITPLMLAHALYIPLLAILPPTLLAWWFKKILFTQSYGIQLVVIGPAFCVLYGLLVLPGYRHELTRIISLVRNSSFRVVEKTVK